MNGKKKNRKKRQTLDRQFLREGFIQLHGII